MKKLREKNLDILILFGLAFVFILVLPFLVPNKKTPSLSPQDPVKEEQWKEVPEILQRRVLKAVGYSFLHLSSFDILEDEETLNKTYEEVGNYIVKVAAVEETSTTYEAILLVLFRRNDMYYQDKDYTMVLGTLKSPYDFNSNLFKEHDDLWEYRYRIDKETLKVLHFQVNK